MEYSTIETMYSSSNQYLNLIAVNLTALAVRLAVENVQSSSYEWKYETPHIKLNAFYEAFHPLSHISTLEPFVTHLLTFDGVGAGRFCLGKNFFSLTNYALPVIFLNNTYISFLVSKVYRLFSILYLGIVAD